MNNTMPKPSSASGLRTKRRRESLSRLRPWGARSSSLVIWRAALVLVIAYPWIDQRIEDIDEQIGPGIDDCQDNQIALQQRVIARRNGLHKQTSKARPGEYQLD